MNRPKRTERSPTHGRGRPKRRAAASHLFKYQLACDPSRAEDNALKKALQQSLEEQKDSLSETVVTPNKSLDDLKHTKKTRLINSSTNSSDVSNGDSNNTSSASSESRNSSFKRNRSSLASPVTPLLSNKRAKLTSNGHEKSSPRSNNSKEKCDNGPSVLSGSPPPLLNKAIRTYSRNSKVNGYLSSQQQGTHQQIQDKEVSPRSSTPIVKKQTPSNGKSHSEKTKSNQVIEQHNAKATQTTTPVVKTSNTQPSKNEPKHKHPEGESKHHNLKSNDKDEDTKDIATQPPVVEYLKFKRESKNYAYAKMTALYVNTSKFLSSGVSRSSTKKVSPTCVLNNNSTNKNVSKTSPKDGCNFKSSVATRKGPSPSPHNSQGKSRALSKHSDVSPSGLKMKHTLDLSTIQTNTSGKQTCKGSWSLLGVPEEKVIYLRDDEPPRRMICYPAIKHIEGDVIQVRDSVLLRSGPKQTDLPYIAKVVAFWEDAETGNVMLSLFWYYRPEHIEEGRRPHHLPDEIFASRHRDVDSVECIEDKCFVLTFNEYCRWRKRLKMEQVNTTWSLSDVTIPLSNEVYPRRNRIPDTSVNPELVFCCRQIYDSRMKRLIKNPLINPKYGHI